MINDQETDLHLLMFSFDAIASLFLKAYKLDETRAAMVTDCLFAFIVQFTKDSGRGKKQSGPDSDSKFSRIDGFDSVYSGQIVTCFFALQEFLTQWFRILQWLGGYSSLPLREIF